MQQGFRWGDCCIEEERQKSRNVYHQMAEMCTIKWQQCTLGGTHQGQLKNLAYKIPE
jgi:hypothetical protein